MKIALGFYTQLTENAPSSAFRRVFSILKPMLTYLLEHPEYTISLSLSDAYVRYLNQSVPEVNLLMRKLAKQGQIEFLTTAYASVILPLAAQKDRTRIIDRTTTLLRRTYGVRATSLFLPGQIWTPSLVGVMKTVSLERLVISSFDAISGRNSASLPYRMSELGRNIDVIPARDSFSRLLWRFSEGEIPYDVMLSCMCMQLRGASLDEVLPLMLSLDQLAKGSCDEDDLSSLVPSLFEAGGADTYSILMQQIVCSRLGYLPSSWYGRDADTCHLSCFNELFVFNENLRYYLARVRLTADLAAECRKEKSLRKAVTDALSSIPSSSLFLFDAMASSLRLLEHRHFWKTLIEAEEQLAQCGLVHQSCDVDGDGLDEEFCRGRVNSALFSRRGATAMEFLIRSSGLNLFDTVPRHRDGSAKGERVRSFSDTVSIRNQVFPLRDVIFELEEVGRNRTEFTFAYTDNVLPVEVVKSYKLTNQNLYLEITLVNRTDEHLSGSYQSDVFFSLPPAHMTIQDPKGGAVVTSAPVSGVRALRCLGKEGYTLVFTSSDAFTATAVNNFQGALTASGPELLYLYTKLSMIYKIDIASRSAMTFSIVMKITGNKENLTCFCRTKPCTTQ